MEDNKCKIEHEPAKLKGIETTHPEIIVEGISTFKKIKEFSKLGYSKEG